MIWLVRPWLDLLAATTYLLQGHGKAFCAVFRAWRDFLHQRESLRQKRRAIQRVQNGKASRFIYHGSLLLRYLCGVRRFNELKIDQ